MFNLDEKVHKKPMLSIIGQIWWDFKNRGARDYIRIEKSNVIQRERILHISYVVYYRDDPREGLLSGVDQYYIHSI